jgi:hypothetical protein
MCSLKEQGAEGPFFNIGFGRKFGLVQDADLASTARGLFDMFQEKGVVVKDEDPEDNPNIEEGEIPF